MRKRLPTKFRLDIIFDKFYFFINSNIEHSPKKQKNAASKNLSQICKVHLACYRVVKFKSISKCIILQLSSKTKAIKFDYNLNFRYANYYRNGSGVQFRDLIKAYGILIIFTVEAQAGRFSIVSLAINIGTGLALLGLVI